MSKSKSRHRKQARATARREENHPQAVARDRVRRGERKSARVVRREQEEEVLAQTRKPNVRRCVDALLKGEPHPRDTWFSGIWEALDLEGRDRFVRLLRVTRSWASWKDEQRLRLYGLALVSWVREPEDWSMKGSRGENPRFVSLTEHLLCKYPVPRFIVEFPVQALYALRGGHGWLTQPPLALLQLLGRGGSVRKAVEERLIPIPLTKRMCHLFLTAPADSTILFAARRAQILASGGEERLVKPITDSRFFSGAPGDEAFKLTWIEWLCRQGMLDLEQVGPLTDYVMHERAEAREAVQLLNEAGEPIGVRPAYSVVGRSAASLERGMRSWHRDLRAARAINHWNAYKPPAQFKPSGWAGMDFPAKEGHPQWNITEILTYKRLLEEGKRLHHCVASYAGSIDKGTCSIWSLRYGHEPAVTIEVLNGSRRIVQKRGLQNRKTTAEEERYIASWAARNSFTPL